jgi:hypothetical protein
MNYKNIILINPKTLKKNGQIWLNLTHSCFKKKTKLIYYKENNK